MAKKSHLLYSDRGDNPEVLGENKKQMPLHLDRKVNLDAGHPGDEEQSKDFERTIMFDPIIYIFDLKGELQKWTQDSGKRMIPKDLKKYIGGEEKISNEEELYGEELTGDKIGALVVLGPTEAICVIFGKETDAVQVILSKIMKMIPFTDVYSLPTVQKEVSIQSVLKKILPVLSVKYLGEDLNRILMEAGDMGGLHGYEYPQAVRTANISHEQNLLKFSERPKLDNVLQELESSSEGKNRLFSESREDDNGFKKNFVDSLENSDFNVYQTAGEDDLAFYYDNDGHCNTMCLSRSANDSDEPVEITHLTKRSKQSSDCLQKHKDADDSLRGPWAIPRMKTKERYEDFLGNAIDKNFSKLSDPRLQKEVEEGEAFEEVWSNNNRRDDYFMGVRNKIDISFIHPPSSPTPARHIPTQSGDDEHAIMLPTDKMLDRIVAVSETHRPTETDVLALSQPQPGEDAKEKEQVEEQTADGDQHHDLSEHISVPLLDASVQETQRDSDENARCSQTSSSEVTNSQNAHEGSADSSERASELASAVETDSGYVPHKTETAISDHPSSPPVPSEPNSPARRTDFHAPVQVSSAPAPDQIHTAWPECRDQSEKDRSTPVPVYPSGESSQESERIRRREEMNAQRQQRSGACGGSAFINAREEGTYVGYRPHHGDESAVRTTEENVYSIETGTHHHDCRSLSLQVPCQETVSPQSESTWQPQSLPSTATPFPQPLQSAATSSPQSLQSTTTQSPHQLQTAATPSPQSLSSTSTQSSHQLQTATTSSPHPLQSATASSSYQLHPASASSTYTAPYHSISLPYPLHSAPASPPSPASRPQLPPIIVHSAGAIPPWATKKARIDLNLAFNRDYVRLNTRRATFGDDWPSDCTIDGANMALCGFFNQGPGRGVRCFFCGLELHNLTTEDNIWDEHVRHSPDCHYLVAIMGPEFLAKTQRCLQEKEKK